MTKEQLNSDFRLYLDPKRRRRDVNSVELDVDIVDAVLPRHKPDAVLVPINVLDEAVIGLARWGVDLHKDEVN